ncbi:MAG: lipoyltransferase [Prevotella sp.]|nr:lipoyltransferase [Prevotella sp.]
MLHIALPDKQVRRLSFYLAMEEYVARHVEAEDCFFMWQVEPSVIFGRNQLIENEVNLDFCRRHHIRMYRRKSGGGCVYADMNNVMFSYVTSEEQVGFTFNRYINMVVMTLHKLGVDASPSGRNDVMIGKRKVSGNAFYKIPGHSIVHGTMLYDTDMLNMAGSLTPPTEKLLSKGVQSIHQHIDVLKNHISLGLEEFMEFVLKELCHDELVLTQDDIRQIELLEQEYLSDEFIYGKNPRYTIVKKRRMEGVGDFEARIEVKNGIIKSVNLMGDFFLVGDLDNGLLKKLRNIPLEAGALNRILPDRIDDIVMNLMKADFINLLTA